MNTVPLAALPSRGVRATSVIAILLMLFLTVFSASPQLHARLHACKISTGAFPKKSTVAKALQASACTKAGEKDDGCAITLFSTGLALSAGAIFLGAIFRFGCDRVFSPGIFSRSLMSRYWLPPLCGPP